MRYWIFINNSVKGPFTIKEIVEKNYISPDLLVCPSEMVATKPSSWYFAKELSEFDPYINTKGNVKLLIDEFEDRDFELREFDISSFNEKAKELDFEEILDIERKRIEEKEKEEYRKKILSFERNIRELDEKLKKAFKSIENYEKSLKEKDLVIERLEKELEEIKRLREEDRKIFEERIKRYEDILVSSKFDDKSKIDSEKDLVKVNDLEFSSELSKDYKDSNFFENKETALVNEKTILHDTIPSKEIEIFKKNEESFSEISNKTDSISFDKNDLNLDTKIDEKDLANNESVNLKEDIKDGFIETKETDLLDKEKEGDKNVDITGQLISEEKESKILPEIDLLSLSKKATEEKNLNNVKKPNEVEINFKKKNYLSEQDESNLEINNIEKENVKKTVLEEDNKEVVYKKFEPLDIKNTDFVVQKSLLDKFDVPVSSFNSVKPIEKDMPFQVADINLEKVETKLDVVPSSKIEKVDSDEILLKPEKKEINVLDEKSNVNSEISKEIGKDLKEDKNEIVSLEKNGISEKQDYLDKFTKKKTGENIFNQSYIKEKDNIELEEKEKKENQNSFATSSQKLTISTKRSKTTKLIALASFSVIIFFFALVYILRSGNDISNLNQSQTKGVYNQVSKQAETQPFDKKEENLNYSKTEAEEDLKIAKINQNVQKAIDIVKKYNLGDGKGSIERWLSNSIASTNGKEEWNATYLSGNLFVVQYRFLRFKSEPIVYLFEVDVEKNEIVRGINNNAINLLAGTKKEKNLNKTISKKFDKHIEKDDEMF